MTWTWAKRSGAHQDLGGKGSSVSRALCAVGIPSHIIGLIGGWTGRSLRDGMITVSIVALTRSAQGLVLAMNGTLGTSIPLSVAARSPIGAGDASLAGWLWAVSFF